jgi:glycerol-3-phosphate dehydrogenase (NAD(P)+)
MKETIGVVGAGSWGTTIAKILGENDKPTLLWAREPEVCAEVNASHRNSTFLPGHELPARVEATGDLREVCERCDLIMMVVPSHVTRVVAREMGNHLRGDQMIVHCTKGIEIETFKRMSEVLREETCLRKIGVLAGPNLAKELAARNPAGTLVASKYEEVVRAAQAALNSRYFRVYGGSDVVGAEVGGSFKNIIAVAAGVADGLKMGDNTKALLITRSLNEMARFGSAMGAELVTFGGMAGIGDLMATCFSPLSRNHQVGERLAQGQTLDEIIASMVMVAEGVKTTRAVHAYARQRGLELPIVIAVHQLLYEGAGVRNALGVLMARQVGREFPGLVL